MKKSNSLKSKALVTFRLEYEYDFSNLALLLSIITIYTNRLLFNWRVRALEA